MKKDGVAILIASNSGQILARPMIDRAVNKLLRGKKALLGNLMLRSSRMCVVYVVRRIGYHIYRCDRSNLMVARLRYETPAAREARARSGRVNLAQDGSGPPGSITRPLFQAG